MEGNKNRDWCSCAPEHLPHWNFKEGFKMLEVFPACKQHDMDYWELYMKPRTPENLSKRKLSDINLRENIIALGHHNLFAWIYFIAVRWFGWIGLWGKEE
jgi:hypothetical protein